MYGAIAQKLVVVGRIGMMLFLVVTTLSFVISGEPTLNNSEVGGPRDQEIRLTSVENQICSDVDLYEIGGGKSIKSEVFGSSKIGGGKGIRNYSFNIDNVSGNSSTMEQVNSFAFEGDIGGSKSTHGGVSFELPQHANEIGGAKGIKTGNVFELADLDSDIGVAKEYIVVTLSHDLLLTDIGGKDRDIIKRVVNPLDNDIGGGGKATTTTL